MKYFFIKSNRKNIAYAYYKDGTVYEKRHARARDFPTSSPGTIHVTDNICTLDNITYLYDTFLIYCTTILTVSSATRRQSRDARGINRKKRLRTNYLSHTKTKNKHPTRVISPSYENDNNTMTIERSSDD